MDMESNRSIITMIAERHNFTFDDMVSQSRKSKYRQARKECAMHLRNLGLSYPRIGKLMNREWQSIIAMCQGRGTGMGKICLKCPTALNNRNRSGYCRKCFCLHSTHSKTPLYPSVDPRISWCPPALLTQYRWLTRTKKLPATQARSIIEDDLKRL